MPIYRDNVNQDYIDEGGKKLRGLSGVNTTTQPSGFSKMKGILSEQTKIAREEPFVQPLSNLVGETEFGESKYDVDISNISQLADIEDTRSKIQPFVDKLGAGLATFAGKTLTATVGGTIGALYGTYEALANGEFNKFYNNDFQKWLDKANSGIDDTFKVHLSDAERNGSFFDQTIGSAGFWTKSLLGDGMSFTAGAVLSTMLTGGALNALSKTASALKDSSTIMQALEEAGALSKITQIDKITSGINKAAKIANNLVVGSAYEGGVEANDFINRSTEKFKSDFYAKNNRLPNDSELSDFNNKILPTANALFLGNVALVGASNFATLPEIFGKGVNESIKASRKLITPQLTEQGVKLGLKESEQTGLQKAFSISGKISKPLASEGLMEEGGQNFGKNLALDYIDKTYNPDAAKNNYDLANSLGNAFTQAYGTADGWKEILSGMIIGGLGSPNIKKFGRIETDENGKKFIKPFSLDADKSWWTGGVLGEFQDHAEKTKRAQELIEDYNKQDKQSAVDYMYQNWSNNQGISSQISDINHMNALSKEYDNAVAVGDLYTAKNAEEDKFHSYVKSRIDAGYFDDLHKDLIAPIEKMSPDEFAASFGYKNMTNDKLTERKNKTVEQAKNSIERVSKSIEQADSQFSFNLGTDEGRTNRDLLIYALTTSNAVNDRIDQLHKSVKELTKGKIVENTKTDEYVLKASLPIQEKISELEKSKEGKSEEEIDKINLDILDQQEKLDEIESNRKLSKEANELMNKYRSDHKSIRNMRDMYKLHNILAELHNPLDNSPEEQERSERVNTALSDLHKLYRRKEEATALYNISKNPLHFSEFFKKNKLQDRIDTHREKAQEKIIEHQNEEISKAENVIKSGGDINKAHSESGAEISQIAKVIRAMSNEIGITKIKKAKTLLDRINSVLDHKFNSLEEVMDSINELSPEEQAIPNVALLKSKIEQLEPESVEEVVNKAPDKNTSKDSIGNDDDSVLKSSGIDKQTSDFINEDVKKDLDKKDSLNKKQDVDDDGHAKLYTAYDHMAYLGMTYKIVDGNFVDIEINEDASKTTLDFNKLNVGDDIEFVIMDHDSQKTYDENQEETTWGNKKEQLKDNQQEINWHVPIAIKKNGEILGYVHTIDYIRADRVIPKNENLDKNKKELIEFREFLVKKGGWKSKINYRGNGGLITSKENIPTIEALTDKNVIITTVTKGVIDKSNFKGGEIINEESIKNNTNNNFSNGIFALLPVNKNSTTGETQYIAAPLSPKKLGDNPNAVKTISNLVRLFFEDQLGEKNESFDNIAKEIVDKIKIKDEAADKYYNFDVRTIDGLNNVIKLFTYGRISNNDDLGFKENKQQHEGKYVFGINQISPNMIVMSFGQVGRLQSLKFQSGDENAGLFKKSEGDVWRVTDADNPMAVLDDTIEELEGSLSLTPFYHNKIIPNKTVNIPTVDIIMGAANVSFEPIEYSEFLKQNTQTNLRSHNIGTETQPSHIYAIQGNISYNMPNYEVSKPGEVKLEQQDVFANAPEGFGGTTWTEESMDLATQVQEKDIQQEESWLKPSQNATSEDFGVNFDMDFAPDFKLSRTLFEETTGFKILKPSENLGTSYVDFAKSQRNPQLRRSIIQLLREHIVESNCKY